MDSSAAADGNDIRKSGKGIKKGCHCEGDTTYEFVSLRVERSNPMITVIGLIQRGCFARCDFARNDRLVVCHCE